MAIRHYQDLEVWHKARDVVLLCYESARSFPDNERYGLTSQIQRAAVSVPANSAEGHARGYTKEYLRHLSIALGSLAELGTLLTIVLRLGYLANDQFEVIAHRCNQIGRMLAGLRRSLNQRTLPSPQPQAPNS